MYWGNKGHTTVVLVSRYYYFFVFFVFVLSTSSNTAAKALAPCKQELPFQLLSPLTYVEAHVL